MARYDFWREGAGEWAFSNLDVRLRNLLFKGDVLKIADMGQSRILMAGQTGMDTATAWTRTRPDGHGHDHTPGPT